MVAKAGLAIQQPSPYDSKTEALYAKQLDKALANGLITAYWSHPGSLKLGEKLHYSPDFLVQLISGELEYHEVKGGFVRDDARVKLRAAAKIYHCYRFVQAQYNKKAWTITIILPD